jgi:hypothetical protein
MSRTILVDRLLEFLPDPFPCIGLTRTFAEKKVNRVTIQDQYDNPDDVNTRRLDRNWNIGRVAFFTREIFYGRKLDPIDRLIGYLHVGIC